MKIKAHLFARMTRSRAVAEKEPIVFIYSQFRNEVVLGACLF